MLKGNICGSLQWANKAQASPHAAGTNSVSEDQPEVVNLLTPCCSYGFVWFDFE